MAPIAHQRLALKNAERVQKNAKRAVIEKKRKELEDQLAATGTSAPKKKARK